MVRERTSEKTTLEPGDPNKSQQSPSKEVKMKLKKCRRSEAPLEGHQLEAKTRRSVEPKSFVIAASKNRARVGSYMPFRKGPAPGMETSVAKIIQLERTSIRGVYNVHVRWLYNLEDTRCGKLPYHGRMEVLLSDHVTMDSSASVVELCRVFIVDAYILRRLTSADSRTYYWRFHYETTTTHLDLQLEMEQIRGQQKIMEEKHQVDIAFLQQRAKSFQNQLLEITNRCSHVEESLQILKYILDKCSAPSSSSNNVRNASPDDKTDASTGRTISIY